MSPFSFMRFVYCDTNILSHLAKHPALWPGWTNYLTSNDLTLAIGSQLAELSDATRIHESLVRLLTTLPAALIKPWDEVLSEEVAAHPRDRSAPLLMYPLNALHHEAGGLNKLREFLSSSGLAEARAGQRVAAKKLPERHATLQPNFPPGAGGKYAREQANEFAWVQALQWLVPTHRAFLEQFRSDPSRLRSETFKSVRLFSLVVYFKYYLGRREPTRSSDFGDLAHLYAIPYCEAAVMEKDLANVLSQIKRHDPVLESTEIYDISVVDRWATAG